MIIPKSKKPLPTTLEIVALATNGWVTGSKVASIAASYYFEKLPETNEVNITIKNSRQSSTSEFNDEVSKISKVLDSFADKQDCQPFLNDSNLTFNDLQEIWQALVQSDQTIQSLLQNSDFNNLFPYADLVSGSYESLRHKSGCEIKLETRKNNSIISHQIDAPNPVAKEIKQNQSIFNDDGYLGLDQSRWRISKMLGATPTAYKTQVFSWAADAIHTVEEFHNTHGGVALPEVFKFKYDNILLTFDRDLKFEQNIEQE